MSEPVSAGDVGRFVYCPLNWKLAHEGHKGRGGREGMEAVEHLSDQVDALELYRGRAGLSIQTSFYLGLMTIPAAAIAVEVFALEGGSRWWWVLLFLSVLWLAMSLYLFSFHLYYQSRVGILSRAHRLRGAGRVDLGTAQKPRLLESRALPLRGKPDLLTTREGNAVPVVVKTGKTPREPFDSHVLQLAAYCYLVGEESGKRPPVGILAYSDRQFEVPYDSNLEDRLMRTLLRMELAQRTGVVHRDHTSRRRCLGCSRREGCPERLA